MKSTRFLNFECVCVENPTLSLLVTRSVGPRIISLRFREAENLLAVLPDFMAQRPDGSTFHFYGGHRLWRAPESMPGTYTLDDGPVEIIEAEEGLLVTQPVETETGIEKSIHISLAKDEPRVTLRHTLTNRGSSPLECAPWAITQFRTGGVAILPQSQRQTDLLPNRSLALWPYTRMESPQVCWGDRHILVRAEMTAPFKVGFPNTRGWLGYWAEGTLFIKRAVFDPRARYYDLGSSSECYCNDQFLELETLAPAGSLAPGEAATHIETWQLYADVERPADQETVQRIVDQLGLE
jgi:hypothetical protein